ncbi:unnamed protein product [Cyprideis torosa]|uniref:Uncharacterized protein n=1 Tax=Cyprideis torosa TaxID=163714 RepID=A0A7R8WNH4_9CRUS|nr:unnamed protein product [Cyprideis torosa]CAG0906303.1 unnamed protein product [Cyprideis torosa]
MDVSSLTQWKPDWYQRSAQNFVDQIYTLREEISEENILKIVGFFMTSLNIIAGECSCLSKATSNTVLKDNDAVEHTEFKYEVSPSSVIQNSSTELEDGGKELLHEYQEAPVESRQEPPRPKVKKKPAVAVGKDEASQGKKEYACEACGEKFRSRTGLFSHRMRLHRSAIQCSLCGQYVRSHLVDSHMAKHANDPEVKCNECGKTFKGKKDLTGHYQRNHKPENWVVCDTCGKSVYKYFMKAHLESHMFKDPNFVPPEDYRCKLCGTLFASDTRLTLHMKTVHKPADLICSHCGKAFKYKKKFIEHEAMHTGTKLYTCDKCGEGFIKAEKLRIHKKKHDNLRPHQCTYCEKAFFDKFGLAQHLNTHTGERPFVCKYCGLSYTASGSMHTHIRIKHKWDGKRYDARRRKKITHFSEDGVTGMQELSLSAHPQDDSSMSTTGL